MAIKSLDNRLDQLAKENASLDAYSSEAAKASPLDDLSMQTTSTPQEFDEGVQVASLRGGIKLGLEAVKAATKKTTEPIVREAATGEKAIEEVKKAVQATGKKVEEKPVVDADAAPLAGEVEAAPVEVVAKETTVPVTAEDKAIAGLSAKAAEKAADKPNFLDELVVKWDELRQRDMSGNVPGENDAVFLSKSTEVANDTNALIEALARVGGTGKKRITWQGVERDIDQKGYGVDFLDKLVSGKLNVDPETAKRVANTYVAAVDQIEAAVGKIAKGIATPEEIVKTEQAVQLAQIVTQASEGYITNISQSFGILRAIRTPDVRISDLMTMVGDQGDMQMFAQAYMKTKSVQGRADLIKARAVGNKWEKVFGVYVNTLLQNPGTHVKNFLSNTIFLPYRLTERVGAAGIGSARRMFGLGEKDAYRLSEVSSIVAATPHAMLQGIRLAGHAFTEGVPKDWTDPLKIARQQQRMELFNRSGDGSLADLSLKALNMVATMPGRALMTADQFFRTINQTHELTAETTRLALNTYDEALAAGKSAADAEALASEAIAKFVKDPPPGIKEQAEVGTFTQRLEGTAGKIAQTLQPDTPMKLLVRSQLPFLSTPINIYGEVVSRTPLELFSRNLRADLKKGGTRESDMALAKIGISSALMYQSSQWASQGVLTGSGPGDRAKRAAMERQGWQAYSYVYDAEDGVIDNMMRLAIDKYPGKVTQGAGDFEGKIFISYQGLEPFGALLGMGADVFEFAKYERDENEYSAVVGGLVFGLANYMLEHPFLQGVSNFASLIGGVVPNKRENFIRIVNGMTEMAGTALLTTAKMPVQAIGLMANDRPDDEAYRYAWRDHPNLPAGIQGLADAFDRQRARTPGYEALAVWAGMEPLEVALNVWGKEIIDDYPMSPLRARKGKYDPVDQALDRQDISLPNPSYNITVVDSETGLSVKTKLSDRERNKMIRIANDELKLRERIGKILSQYEKYNGVKRIQYRALVEAEFSQVFDEAREKLIEESVYSGDIKNRAAEKAAALLEFEQGR